MNHIVYTMAAGVLVLIACAVIPFLIGLPCSFLLAKKADQPFSLAMSWLVGLATIAAGICCYALGSIFI